MAWNNPRTWTNGEVVNQTMLNPHLRDNLAYLANRPSGIGLGGGADYSTSSSSWANIDASNLSKTITVQAGGRLLAIFQGSVYLNNSNLAVALRIAINGTDYSFGKTYGNLASQVPYRTPFVIVAAAENLSPGSYTVTPQWRTISGATAIIHSASALMSLLVFEL